VRARLVAILLFAVALVLGACAKRLLTRFPHVQHLTEIECGEMGKPKCLSCASCHLPGTEGTWEKPRADQCSRCHEGEAKVVPPSRPKASVRPAAYDVIFSHEKHLELKAIKGQCVDCHAGAVGVQGGPPLFPPMSACLSCHEHREQFDRKNCGVCHDQRELRELRPSSFVSHDGAWLERHGADARHDGATCSLCHTQTSCDSCHDSNQTLGAQQRQPEEVTREFIHRFDFVSRHAIEATSQPGQCLTCHTTNQCDACHAQRGVSGALRTGRSPHPPGWSSGAAASTNLHGREARRDITSCAACHDQGPMTNCVRCHRPGGLGGTPHSPGWNSTESRSGPGCIACHGGP
jgi:hypothetical protein